MVTVEVVHKDRKIEVLAAPAAPEKPLELPVKMMNILVYGTLRQGMYNHNHYLLGYKPLKRVYINGIQLYDLGPYPYTVKTGKPGGTVFEQYLVPESVAWNIHRMEIGAGYCPAIYKNKDGEELMFWTMTHKLNPTDKLIKHGDYVAYWKRK